MPKKLTHSEFMEKFYEKNSNANNIEILGKYVNAHTKIKCRCKIDNHIWETKPNHLLSGKGCPMCGGTVKKTHEQFIKELEEINPNIEVLGEYINARTKILCRCKIDGYKWEAKPSSLLSGYGCPKCAIDNQRKTHEEFIKELAEINPNIEVLGEYVNSSTKILCRCKIDNHIWEVIPSNLLSGSGCPMCSGNVRKTTESFIKELEEINPNIEVLGEYVNSSTKILCRCKIDNHIWETQPNCLLSGCGCPMCSGNVRKTTESFIKELEEINPNIEVLGEYVNSSTKILCRCKIDNHIWKTTPNNLLSGSGCPKCNSSKGEKAIAKYLSQHNIKFEEQYRFEDCRFYNPLPFDFYIPSLNIAIEYDGKQHFEIVDFFGGLDNFIDTKIRDTIKTIYCKDHNIKLIRIPYWKLENTEKILNEKLN